MTQQTTIDIPANTWTLLTDTDVTNVTFQCFGKGIIHIKGATDATAPTDTDGSFQYTDGQGEINVSLAELFPGVSSAAAYCNTQASITVGHA